MQWEAYRNLSGLAKIDPAKQVQVLTLCLSRETIAVVHNLGLSDEQMKDVAQIITAMRRYVDGHVNETVERRNFRRRVQQPGESFDDFLISLRELAKTCKFCSEACMQKSIRDQIIEGLSDGDTIEDLLQESELSLAATITKCQSREAAKKHRVDITTQGTDTVAALRKPQEPMSQVKACPGCGGPHHRGGRSQCPAFAQNCSYCHKVGHFAKVCRGKSLRQAASNTPSQASANAIRVQHQLDNHIQLYNVTEEKSEAAPTIRVNISSSSGMKQVEVLPDSGADISAAGQGILRILGQHVDNLLPSSINPRAVNGSCMTPIGKVPVRLQLEGRSYDDDLHIYPGVTGALISWKAAKGLGILPAHYPQPEQKIQGSTRQPKVQTTGLQGNTHSVIAEELMLEFSSVFDGEVTAMEGETFAIALMEGAKPFCVKTPRTVPFAYRDKLKKELDQLQQQGIITPVTEPTEWCSPIVVTPKKGTERIRLCVDLSKLNRYVRREKYISPTPAEAVADIAAEEAKFFTVLDAKKGYHQCLLEEASQLMTTFITPFGRFKYCRAPYGLSSIAEHYNRRMADAFQGLTGFRRIVDDIIIYDKDEATHKEHVRQFLKRCQDKKITLNREKCKFYQTEVAFAGFHLSTKGYRIDPAITNAITKFPSPTTRTDLKSFFGLANQLAAGTDKIAELLEPLRPLLSSKNEFVWSTTHEQALSKAKQHLASTPTLAFFDMAKLTRICTDASRQGVGFVLQQQSPKGQWTLVQAGSRFLSSAESRYAIIELELLAVAWAVSKCNVFLMGLQHFQIVTDHNPLIPILNSHRLDEIENPRLQRLRTKLMAYNFTAVWCKGATNCAPDALSRHPTGNPDQADLLAECEDDRTPEMTLADIRAIESKGSQESVRVQEVRECAQKDDEYQQLKRMILEGFPDHRGQLPDGCKQYWQARYHLTLDNDLIVYGCRLLIPAALRKGVLAQLHKAHQGIVQTKERARLSIYWPGINNDIENMIAACVVCQDHLPSQCKEPMVAKPRPARPFQETAADLCYYAGRQYLIWVDCYTDWPIIVSMGKDTTAKHLTTAFTKIFAQTAVPDVLWTDRGPQFMAHQFQSFAKQWGFRHYTSTPYYPQSNGKAEATVKSMKKIIRTAWNGRQLDEETLCQALLQYRNTPTRKDGLSPAQKLYGCPLQDMLPVHNNSFAPEWQHKVEEAEQSAQAAQEAATKYYNSSAHNLPDITVGSHVAVQHPKTKLWDTYGVVIHIGPSRQYHVQTGKDKILIRNRRFLRRRVPASIPIRTSVERQPMPPRRSLRARKPVNRLIEDPAWA